MRGYGYGKGYPGDSTSYVVSVTNEKTDTMGRLTTSDERWSAEEEVGGLLNGEFLFEGGGLLDSGGFIDVGGLLDWGGLLNSGGPKSHTLGVLHLISVTPEQRCMMGMLTPLVSSTAGVPWRVFHMAFCLLFLSVKSKRVRLGYAPRRYPRQGGSVRQGGSPRGCSRLGSYGGLSA